MPADTGLCRFWFIFCATALLLSAFLGLAAALKVAMPESWVGWLHLEMLRPLHLFLVISGLLAGIQGMIGALMGDKTGLTGQFQVAALCIFVLVGSAALLAGKGTGREYFSWPVALTPLLLLSLVILLVKLAANRKRLFLRSPEGGWLLGLGCSFILLGVIESQLWIFRPIALNYVKDLSLQWHGIDTFFAGLNMAFYGGAIYLMDAHPKPLRSKMLYGVAVTSLLFTFGHHHYISPQPDFFKIAAVIASLLALVSFFRHLRAFRCSASQQERHYQSRLWRSIEVWTLVSVASGVLFAIPQINLLVHGTHLVVVHAMGSMIGVSFLIIVLAALRGAQVAAQPDGTQVRRALRWINIGLSVLWLVLGAAGLAKGVLRAEGGYLAYRETLQWLLLALPVVGLILMTGIVRLCILMIRCNWPLKSKNWNAVLLDQEPATH